MQETFQAVATRASTQSGELLAYSRGIHVARADLGFKHAVKTSTMIAVLTQRLDPFKTKTPTQAVQRALMVDAVLLHILHCPCY